MPVETWARNPRYYVKECVEVGVDRIVFDRGFLVKYRIDPYKFLNLYYGAMPWKSLIIDDSYGTALIDSEHDEDHPLAVYPTWTYGDDFSLLEEMIQNPVGQDRDICFDPYVPVSKRPVFGQEHRVVLNNTPPANTGLGRAFYRLMRDLQDENPDCIIHVHGLYSYRIMFGTNFKSVDFDPRSDAAKGKVVLPSGKTVTYERAAEEPHWINLLGMRPSDLKVPRNRCMYNILSADWAAHHFKETLKFKHRGYTKVDPEDPNHKVVEIRSIFAKRRQQQDGDMFLCDLCTLQTSCKYFRTGAICAVPDSEPEELARFFQTRDSETIIDGLGTLLAAQSRRLQNAMEKELEDDKIDSEVTKILNTLFDRGVKLAKLVDPRLAAAGAAKITLNQATINNSSPQQMIASVVDELVRRGVPRHAITPEMIQTVLSGGGKEKAIEVGEARIAEA